MFSPRSQEHQGRSTFDVSRVTLAAPKPYSFGESVGLGDLLSLRMWVVLGLVVKVSLEEDVLHIGGVIDCELYTG